MVIIFIKSRFFKIEDWLIANCRSQIHGQSQNRSQRRKSIVVYCNCL